LRKESTLKGTQFQGEKRDTCSGYETTPDSKRGRPNRAGFVPKKKKHSSGGEWRPNEKKSFVSRGGDIYRVVRQKKKPARTV